MKTKLDLAHEWYMKNMYQTTHEKAVVKAWNYADAMYEQLEKRESRGVPEGILNRCNSTKLEWQPDWSQAPAGFNRFVVGSDGGYGFFTNIEPELMGDYYFVGFDGVVFEDHGYKGHWKDSLRKRPEDK